MKKGLCGLLIMALPMVGMSQLKWDSKFEQLGSLLPAPNKQRTASGAPGKEYWQQRTDYDIEVELNDEDQSITGSELITFHNLSPDVITYLWIQLDQNLRAQDSDTPLVEESRMKSKMSSRKLLEITGDDSYSGGYNISAVTDADGKDLSYVINKTMMRVNLPKPIEPGASYSLKVNWSYYINDRMKDGGRSGYEYFPKEDNYIYAIAQWFPRMALYNDIEGWQNKQFLGQGEFTLPFGNYKVRITVPADHMLGATGTLQNPEQVLSAKEQSRLRNARRTFNKPVIITTQKEAVAREKSKSREKKTWVFEANDIRDFAFTSSRKFIWDAMAVDINGTTVMAMSYYPKEGNPLWEKESTRAVANTLKTYSKYTIDYPYPKAISVHTASIGMEYPMICFNYGRPDEDGDYTQKLLEGMVGVIVHEVGHNFFPMIINSDERQWTWMDEGLNSFLERQTLVENYPNFDLTWGSPIGVIPYMMGEKEKIRPIMTNSEQVLQFGYNAYGKPSAGLVMLRETIMGPELFDFAFKKYAERWAFKHPSPADFFRTMEDASGMDLDWFWKGWFFTTDHVDISLEDARWFRSTEGLEDLDADYEPATFTIKDTRPQEYGEFLNKVDDQQIAEQNANKNFYQLTFVNRGGLVMPIIIEWAYSDGTTEVQRIPAEIWKLNEQWVTKVFAKNKIVVGIEIDPFRETADIDTSNNSIPRRSNNSRFDQYKSGN